MAEVQFAPAFEPLFAPATYKVVYGGRGSTKSWGVAQKFVLDAIQGRHRILCTRELMQSLKESVYKLLEDTIERMGVTSMFTFTKDSIVCNATGSEFIFSGLRNNVTKIKGLEGITRCWAEEAENISEESWDILIPTLLRNEGVELWVVFNPRRESDATWQRFVVNPPKGAIVVRMNLWDNPWATQAMLDEAEECRQKDPLRWRWVWNGECLKSIAHALFPWESIESNRLAMDTELTMGRVVVAVDPAVTANKRSDETGIVVAGASRSVPRHYYVLGDLSGRMLPEDWGIRALDAYDKYEADAIVYEANQGGLLVEENIRNVCRLTGRPVPKIEAVRATRGKVVRAEPVSALYTQHLVHHIGRHPKLEEQMLTYDPLDPNSASPDRMDALVWALTYLGAARAPMKLAPSILDRFAALR